MADDEEREVVVVNVIGAILIFSFISVVFFFITMLILGGINNYGLQKMYDLLIYFTNIGLIPSSFGDFANEMESLGFLAQYLDILWLGSFVTMSISSVIVSYHANKNDYFSTFTVGVFGLIILSYIGSIFIQLTDWFRVEILEKVFPNLLSDAQFFTWYLDNIGVINLILLVICILANFIEIDFSRFNKDDSDGGGSLDEI